LLPVVSRVAYKVGIHVFESNWTHVAHILADTTARVDLDAMADLMG